MIEPTLFNAGGLLIGAIGVLFASSGLRWAIIDEFVIGIVLLLLSWFMLA